MKRYKFLRDGTKSQYGEHAWEVGKWYEYTRKLELCESGFHCSKGIYQAFSYIQGEILAEVEAKGESIREDTKEVYSKMRVTKIWKWQKIDSVLFSIYAAYLCLDSFEKFNPNDKRPRLAIEAAERWVKEPTETNRSAARSARLAAESAAAWSAVESARLAVESAAAWSAAESAESAAARSAARSARLAAESAAAESAESAAAESAIYKKLDKWMLNHLQDLEEIK